MQMLFGNMNVGRTDAAFQVLPKIVQIVGVRLPVHIFACAVINRVMIVASLFQSPIRFQFIRVNYGAIQNIFLNNRLERFLGNIRDNFRHYLSITLHHAKNDSLVRGTASAFAASSATANIGFINFNLAVERQFIVNLRHVFSDFVSHAPRRFVGYAKLPHQFHSRNPMPGSREHVNGDEPRLQRSPAIFKKSSGCRVNVTTAHTTAKSTLRLNPIPFGFTAAFWAFIALPETAVKNVLQTGLVVGELSEKFFQRRPRIHFVRFHASNIHPTHPLCQGDNSVLFYS